MILKEGFRRRMKEIFTDMPDNLLEHLFESKDQIFCNSIFNRIPPIEKSKLLTNSD
jgi:hypothetical protein